MRQRGLKFGVSTRRAFNRRYCTFSNECDTMDGGNSALYALCVGRPGSECTIRSPGAGSGIPAGRIADVTMLEAHAELEWSQDDAGLKIRVTAERPCDHACTFKIALEDLA